MIFSASESRILSVPFIKLFIIIKARKIIDSSQKLIAMNLSISFMNNSEFKFLISTI